MAKINHQKVKEIFSSAIELPLDEQMDFLVSACQDDADLHHEVESLLKARYKAENFLEGVSAPNTLHDSINKNNQLIGQKIDKYRIISELGRGGMGVVFLAEREDFRQKVALKLIKRGMDSEAILERFSREREILASLNHPFIAHFLDGGTTENGSPFFVMELVEGVPFNDFCRQKNLSVEQKLELFIKICEAVSFAHQKLIIHRDLKPSNILIDTNGSPKLLDFGIAKLLNSTESNETQTQQKVLTPAYASPEQIRGEMVDKTSDVFSLGKILSEILQNDTLNNDLQAILQTALFEERKQRYESAEKLSNDIKRYLAGLPVTAQSPTIIYHLSKYLHRNRLIFIPTAIALSIVILTSGIFAYQRFQYNQKLAELDAITKNLSEVSTQKSGGQSSIETKVAAARSALENLNSLSNQLGADDQKAQLNLANAYLELGDLQGKPYSPNIGDTAGAKVSYEKALEILQHFSTAQDIDYQRITARAKEEFGYFSTIRLSAFEEGFSNIKKALEIRERLYTANPQDTQTRRELSQTLIYYSDAYTYLHQSGKDQLEGFSFSIQFLERSVRLCEDLHRENPNDLQAKRDLASAYQKLSRRFYNIIHVDKSKQKEGLASVEFGEKALEMRKNLATLPASNLIDSRSLADQYLLLGMSYRETDKNEKALEDFRRSLEIFQTILLSDSQNLEAHRDVGNSLCQIGLALMKLHQNSEARQQLLLAKQTFQEILEKDSNEEDKSNLFQIENYLKQLPDLSR